MKIFMTAMFVLLAMPLASFAVSAAAYYVLKGVMEVGAELLLNPDGAFQ